MKVLVLSCNTGGGHNSAAEALRERFVRLDVPCDKADSLSFATEYVSRNVSNSYINMAVKAPAAFGFVYKAGNFVSSAKRKSPVYFFNSLYSRNLLNYILQNGITDVVCTHLFPAQTVTYLRRKGLDDVRLYYVATDYTCIPFCEETEPDFHFIPHSDIAAEYALRGVKREKLVCSGIPVIQKFSDCVWTREAARNDLGIDGQAKVFLIMSGSMGFGNIAELIRKLCDGKDRIVYVLTGNNEAMRTSLTNDFGADARVHILPFTNAVDLYMSACDVVLTKPGGLSSTEAAVMGIPIVHTAPIPGCETKNALFFSGKGMSFFSERSEQAAEQAVRICESAELRESMKDSQKRNIDRYAANSICDFVLNRGEVGRHA